MCGGNKLLLFYEINSDGDSNIRMRSGHVFSAEVGIKYISPKGTSSRESVSTVCHIILPLPLIENNEAMSVDSLCTVYQLNQSEQF